MTAFMLSVLLLSTIVVAFVSGITLGYYVIVGILNLFDPARLQKSRSGAPKLVPSSSGD